MNVDQLSIVVVVVVLVSTTAISQTVKYVMEFSRILIDGLRFLFEKVTETTISPKTLNLSSE